MTFKLGNHAALVRQARQALSELALTLGVSRTTLREALRRLAAEGAVSKSQGLGNFVHPKALAGKVRFDTIPDSVDML
ncbi:MAG: GntR family transcriptional regulator [Bacillota bacterium]